MVAAAVVAAAEVEEGVHCLLQGAAGDEKRI
jgi:hypothetical protein